MSSKALVGASMSGALTYVTCTVAAHLDPSVSAIAAAGVAVIVGAGIHFNEPKEELATEEQNEWEKELLKGGKVEITPE